MSRAEDKNVFQTITPKRSDQAFNVWILPRHQHEVGVLEFCDLDYSDIFDGRVGSY